MFNPLKITIMKKNFKGEARKARRVNAYVAYYTSSSREELKSDKSLRVKVERNPYVTRYWDNDYYLELQERRERAWRRAQEETAPTHLQEQIEGVSKAIRAKEILLKTLMRDIEELSSKRDDLLFLLNSI